MGTVRHHSSAGIGAIQAPFRHRRAPRRRRKARPRRAPRRRLNPAPPRRPSRHPSPRLRPRPRRPPPQAAETPFADLFAQLAARLVGSVVNVSTQTAARAAPPAQEAPQNSPGRTLDEVFREFLGEKAAPGAPGPRVASLGSGFIIDPSGLIVTNHHVIANAQQITVTLSDETVAAGAGRRARPDHRPGAAQGRSRRRRCRPWLGAIPGKARVGDWVLTIGNPFGLGGSVAAGIISAVARDIHSSPYDDYLQTDAAMNRGNSGGPMFNTRRRGDRDQHGHLFAVGRLDRDRVRAALRAGPADHRAAQGDRQGRARLDRRPRSADDRRSRRDASGSTSRAAR